MQPIPIVTNGRICVNNQAGSRQVSMMAFVNGHSVAL